MIALFLVASDPRWVRVVVPLLAVLVLALVLAHYHVVVDILGGAVVAVAVFAAVHRARGAALAYAPGTAQGGTRGTRRRLRR